MEGGERMNDHDQTIIDAVRAGAYRVEWHAIDLAPDVRIEVVADALVVDWAARDINMLRPSTTPVAAQQIADLLGACLLTPLLADKVWRFSRLRLRPQTQPIVPGPWVCPDCGASHSGPWARCQPCGEREHSRAIDAEIALTLKLIGPSNTTELVGNTGKPWALSKSCWAQPGQIGAPYGWFSAGARGVSVTGLPLIQSCRPAGLPAPHSGDQLDYAEPLRLWRGVTHTAHDLLTGPLHALVSHEGALPDSRLPGVPNG